MFEIKFEPRDLWIGLFWDRRKDGLHAYVCLIPCLVFHWWEAAEPCEYGCVSCSGKIEKATLMNGTMGYVGQMRLCRAAIRTARERGDSVYPLLGKTLSADQTPKEPRAHPGPDEGERR